MNRLETPALPGAMSTGLTKYEYATLEAMKAFIMAPGNEGMRARKNAVLCARWAAEHARRALEAAL